MPREFDHKAVMRSESLGALALRPGAVFVDCTLGGAGHSQVAARLIAPDGLLIGIDQDESALVAAKTRLAHVGLETPPVLLKGNFGDLDELLLEAKVPGVDAVLFDLGVSSPQFDVPERGFSYRSDAPLDMRMDTGSRGPNAAEILNTYSEADLARVLREGGEEKWAARIARLVCQERVKQPIATTFQLVDIVKRAIPARARRSGGHPAKRTFQALRVEVNHELDALRAGLDAAIRWLEPAGRLAVISYQSLEDSIVKETFRNAEHPCVCPPEFPVCVCGRKPVLRQLSRKPVFPSADEVERNPRAHSAKLRAAERL